jgi:HJR/Mrr/RecB family endonuclease
MFLVILTLLQVGWVVYRFKTLSRFILALETIFSVSLLWGLLGSYFWSLREHPAYCSFLFFAALCSKLSQVLRS